MAHLQGIINLDKVIVITAFAEIGPWGSSRTRWEMEARGEFTIEGCRDGVDDGLYQTLRWLSQVG
jgi:fatty acid synthase subunit alpha